jgi:F-type H+-transporting ATPase subunit b
MLSRFALRQVCGGGIYNGAKLCAIQPVRQCTVAAPANLAVEFDPRIRAKVVGAKPENDPNKRGLLPNEYEIAPVNPPFVDIETQVANIKYAHDVFYGPERDTKNFPILQMPETIEAYNFMIVPTRFCKDIYQRLGVSGSYTLFLGTLAFFLSKEITPVDHVLPEFLLILIAGSLMSWKLAPKLEPIIDKMQEEERNEMFVDPVNEANATLDEDIGVYEKEIWRLNAIPSIFQAKREQVDLQLEVEYRERLAEVYNTVKSRLDYQAERDFMERKFEQDHMVNWIVRNVKKSITPQQEKENIASCISTLKQLSATAV